MNAVMDTVDAGVHHLQIILLAMGVGVSLLVPAVVFQLLLPIFGTNTHCAQGLHS